MNQNPLDRIERDRRIVAIVQGVLAKRGISLQIHPTELHIGEEAIVETTANKQKLSSAILDHMFPREAAPVDLVHYTPPEGLIGIARTGEMRLYALRKRIDEAEIRTFAEEHKLYGYLASAAGEPYYKELSEDLFYTSLTRGGGNEAVMWGVFARGGTGARLTTRIAPAAAELRSMQYQQRSRTLLNELNGELAAYGAPPFLPYTISKIGAFYLPSCLGVEQEVRLLVKRHPGVALPTAKDGGLEHLPIPIGLQNPFCDIQVLSIELGPIADAAALRTAIRGTGLENVRLVGPYGNEPE